jgi:aminoglycoside N3'-acetyltransferase
MKSTTACELKQHLLQLELKPGSNVFLHSSLSSLGSFEGGVELMYSILRGILGPHGTIAVPAYRLNASADDVFDPPRSPSVGVGVFSEYVRMRTNARRSLNPLHSHAFDGPLSEKINVHAAVASFGPGSDFDFFLREGFRGLLLGCNFESAGTFIFHAQACANNIPYREWQTMRRAVKCYSTDGSAELVKVMDFPYYARKENAPRESRQGIENLLEKRGMLVRKPLVYSNSLSFSYDEVHRELVEMFIENPLASLPEPREST